MGKYMFCVGGVEIMREKRAEGGCREGKGEDVGRM
jgi:hypothetical protein